MRISDWSSDVCSSDLGPRRSRSRSGRDRRETEGREEEGGRQADSAAHGVGDAAQGHVRRPDDLLHGEGRDRKSVVQGKSLSERVNHTGPRNHTKNKTTVQPYPKTQTIF